MALFGVAPQIRKDHLSEFPDWLSFENAKVAGETLLSVAGDTFSTLGVPLASSVLSELVPGLAGPLRLALPALGFAGNTALKSASQLVGAGDFTFSSSAFESFQTQLSHLLGTGIAFGAKGLFKSSLAGIFAQEMGFSFLLNPFLEISGNLFSGASFSEALSQVSKRFSFSDALTWTSFGLAGTAREIFIKNPIARIALEMAQRGAEVLYQFRNTETPAATSDYLRAFSRGVFSRAMGSTLHAYKLSAAQRGLQRNITETRVYQAAKNLGGRIANNPVVAEARRMVADIRENVGVDGLIPGILGVRGPSPRLVPYSHLSEKKWVEDFHQHHCSDIKDNQSRLTDIVFKTKPDGLQPSGLKIPPEEPANEHLHIRLETKRAGEILTTSIVDIKSKNGGDLLQAKAALACNSLLIGPTKSDYHQRWCELVESRINQLFHGSEGVLGLPRHKANWVYKDLTETKFRQAWVGKNPKSLLEKEPWLEGMQTGEKMAITTTGSFYDPVGSFSCFVEGSSSSPNSGKKVFKITINLTKTKDGLELTSSKDDWTGARATDFARMMNLDNEDSYKGRVISLGNLIPGLEGNEIIILDWARLLENHPDAKLKLKTIGEALTDSDSSNYREGFIITTKLQGETKAGSLTCRPLGVTRPTGTEFVSLEVHNVNGEWTIAKIDGTRKPLWHYHLVTGNLPLTNPILPEAVADAVTIAWKGPHSLKAFGFELLDHDQLAEALSHDKLWGAWEKIKTARPSIKEFEGYLVIASGRYQAKVIPTTGRIPHGKTTWATPLRFNENNIEVGPYPPHFPTGWMTEALSWNSRFTIHSSTSSVNPDEAPSRKTKGDSSRRLTTSSELTYSSSPQTGLKTVIIPRKFGEPIRYVICLDDSIETQARYNDLIGQGYTDGSTNLLALTTGEPVFSALQNEKIQRVFAAEAERQTGNFVLYATVQPNEGGLVFKKGIQLADSLSFIDLNSDGELTGVNLAKKGDSLIPDNSATNSIPRTRSWIHALRSSGWIS